MSLILALDTSTDVLSIAMSVDGKVLLKECDNLHSHEERLLILFSELLSEARASAKDLTQLLLGLGPGSFTGLRVGLSFVKGLCLARQVPLYGYLSPSAFAASIAGDVIVIGDARREEVFLTECGQGGEILSGPEIVSRANLELRLKVRPGAKLVCCADLNLPGVKLGSGVLRGFEPARGLLQLFSAGAQPWIAVTAAANYTRRIAELAPFYVRQPSAKTIAERASGQ